MWVYIFIGIVIGVAVGMLAAAFLFRGKTAGTLRITFAEKGEAPLLFCELKRDLDALRKKKRVTLRIREQWFYLKDR